MTRTVPIEEISIETNAERCAVRKDAGDGPDITDGILVYANVSKTADGQIAIDGGKGVGRVTKKGLDQPVGSASINHVPRRMIEKELENLRKEYGYEGGFSVLIEIPLGESLAAKTFNPQLGIIGGLSVIGTSGIVDPMSTQALLDTIDTEFKMYAAEGEKEIILTPGNYGEKFIRDNPGFSQRAVVKCSNFIGASLDMAIAHGFTSALILGHIGKLVKLAGGVMDTHSKTADCRMELLALHTPLTGGDILLMQRIMDSITTDDALETIDHAGLLPKVMDSVLHKAEEYIQRRTKGAMTVGVVTFSFRFGLLGISPSAENILNVWKES